MEIAASSGNSDATVSALGWYGPWQEKGHGKGKNREKGKRKGKGKGKENKAKEKGGEKGKGKSNSRKGNGGWWNEQREQRWTEPFRGYWCHRKLNATSGKDEDRWNLVQWYRTRHSPLFLTLDPLYRNAFKR